MENVCEPLRILVLYIQVGLTLAVILKCASFLLGPEVA